ncbi:MAG: DMP19 family protein [Pirellulaceae bacterium]
MKKKLTTSEILAAARAAEAGKPPPFRRQLSAEEQKRIEAWEQFDKTAEAVFNHFEESSYDELSQAERDCITLWWLCAEVNSGGFHTFFVNDSGSYIRDTQYALKRIGATETYGILSRAIALFFPSEPPLPDPDKRLHQMEALSAEALEAKVEAVDDAFFRCDEDIKRLYNDYWRPKKGQPN